MKQIAPAIKIFLFFTVVTGLIYPVVVTAIGRVLFPSLAEGGFIARSGQTVGATLIGQKFTSEKYFWGRPSSIDSNPLPSGGSNLGPTSQALQKAVNDRAVQIRKAHGLAENADVPKELLFTSGSGLDPEISPDTAYFQIERVAKARSLTDKQKLVELIKSVQKGADLGFIGEPRVNVLKLNLALDEMNGGH